MRTIMKTSKLIADILNIVAIIALLIMIGVTVADIFMRGVLNKPLTGAVEITRMMMVCMSPSFAAALFEKRHVAVGLLVDTFGRKLQLGFDCFCYILTAVVSALMCYQGIVECLKKMAQNAVYTMLKIPSWPFYVVFAVSMGLFCISILIQLAWNFYDKSYAVPVKKDGGEDE